MQRSIVLLLLLSGCATAPDPGPERRIWELERATGGTIAVAWLDLRAGTRFEHNAHIQIHAASTMKVPLMLALFQAAAERELSMEQPVEVRNSFHSIADGSPYTLDPKDDGDPTLYQELGAFLSLRALVRRMIDRSSNLATNLLIQLVDKDHMARLLGKIGAGEVHVVRGVEDQKAFDAGINNTTSASGMLEVLKAIEERRAVSPAASDEMLAILEKQEFREKIPAGLPPGTLVANKTGDIAGIHNDAAIIDPAGPRPSLLVVLTRGIADQAIADQAIAEISRMMWRRGR